jgi:hypothetical protein
MARNILSEIRSAIASLNPQEVREAALRPVSIGLMASTREAFEAMEDFFSTHSVSNERRLEAVSILHRVSDPDEYGQFDLMVVEEGLPLATSNSFTFYEDDPVRTVREVLDERNDLSLSLARRFPPFRQEVTSRVISAVSRENAMFSLATALPNIVPGLSLPWAAGEFASDTTVLTANQIRMAFLLSAASDRDIGFREQRTEIASLIAGAFGWRSVARQLAGKIPLGGGLIPKAAIAYAGTWVVGISLDRLYRIGYHLTRAERRAAYEEAYERGRQVASAMMDAFRQKLP